MRNLCALHHFFTSDIFGSVIVPWGATCATLVTYPAGLASSAPRDAVFVGPVDPTSNRWFPEGMLALSMPILTANRICEGIEETFVSQRPKVAYPERRHRWRPAKR